MPRKTACSLGPVLRGVSAPRRLIDMDHPDTRDVVDPRLRMVVAVLYVSGLALMVIGSVGGFLWVPLLWCAAAGLVIIAAGFAISGGRF